MQSILSIWFVVAIISGWVPEAFGNCDEKCAERFHLEEEQKDCKEGCRLALIFKLAPEAFGRKENDSELVSDCRNGCGKSYASQRQIELCSYGCGILDLTNENHPVQVSITNQDATFEVANGLFGRIFSRVSNPFSWGKNSLSSDGTDASEWRDPFAEMRRRMQMEMARTQQVVDSIFALHKALNKDGAELRHQDHTVDTSLNSVDNYDQNGDSAIKKVTAPQRVAHLLRYRTYNPKDSWISRILARAENINFMGINLIASAFLICIILLVAIMIAIAKQIRSARYQNIPAHVRPFTPPAFVAAQIMKKVPEEDVQHSATDYPLIHDSPPPAYDQLSVHKTDLEDKDNIHV